MRLYAESTRRLSIAGVSSEKLSRPIEATICAALATTALWKLATRSILSGTSSARASPGFCVATPVGQWLVWHFIAWMQPTANIIPRAERVKSAPWMIRVTMSNPLVILPDAPILMCSRRPVPTRQFCTIIRPCVSGIPTWSTNSCGAAPVPPSAPSTMMKSGVMPVCSIALQIDRNSVREPMHNLNPTGLPSDRLRSVAMKCMSSSGVLNAVCAGGETTV